MNLGQLDGTSVPIVIATTLSRFHSVNAGTALGGVSLQLSVCDQQLIDFIILRVLNLTTTSRQSADTHGLLGNDKPLHVCVCGGLVFIDEFVSVKSDI